MGVNSLPKTVIRQRRGCDLNQGPTAPEFSTLTVGYRATPFTDYSIRPNIKKNFHSARLLRDQWLDAERCGPEARTEFCSFCRISPMIV